MPKYADIIVDMSQDKLDKEYQYRIPAELSDAVTVGTSVMIPFGSGNRQIQGYVTEVSDVCKFDPERIKDISGICENAIVAKSQMVKLAWWIKENYGGTMKDAMKAVLPVAHTVKDKVAKSVIAKLSAEELTDYLELSERKKYSAKCRLTKELLRDRELPYEAVTGKLHISLQTLKTMEQEGVISIEETKLYRNPVSDGGSKAVPVMLNPDQQKIADDIISDIREGECGTYLIHGITGSGKTEVYMAVIEEVIGRGRQVIFLIPEIALTFQMVKRFSARFGDRVSILNSRMSAGERYDQYLRAEKGDIDIIIGPRSALFTPFERLGLIIMDEEHEGSYKSEKSPKYHARGVAEYRAKLAGASVILGSATPSLESSYRAEQGEIKRYFLNSRAKTAALPNVYVEDLKEEIRAGNRSIFSRRLHDLIEDRLKKEQQIMLFLNRRGYAGFVSCRSCGHVMKCPHCDVSLNYHRDGRLICHYCGHEQVMPKLCPECGSPYIAAFGLGTQKVEETVKKEFPNARILRMDADTTAGKEGHEKILSAFADRQADILIGTQMIVKGHDFENVTLVGVIAADLSLFAADYLAAEKTFELLVQASGRAGRGRYAGDVVIQTYHPEHYCIKAAAENRYFDFYDQEIMFRTMSGYPPYSHLLAVVMLGKDEEELVAASDRLASFIREDKGLIKNAPVWARVAKINDIYRRVIYVKSRDMHKLVSCKNELEITARDGREFRNISVQFDFDPVGSY